MTMWSEVEQRLDDLIKQIEITRDMCQHQFDKSWMTFNDGNADDQALCKHFQVKVTCYAGMSIAKLVHQLAFGPKEAISRQDKIAQFKDVAVRRANRQNISAVDLARAQLNALFNILEQAQILYTVHGLDELPAN